MVPNPECPICGKQMEQINIQLITGGWRRVWVCGCVVSEGFLAEQDAKQAFAEYTEKEIRRVRDEWRGDGVIG